MKRFVELPGRIRNSDPAVMPWRRRSALCPICGKPVSGPRLFSQRVNCRSCGAKLQLDRIVDWAWTVWFGFLFLFLLANAITPALVLLFGLLTVGAGVVYLAATCFRPLRTIPGYDGCYCIYCGFDVRQQVFSGKRVCSECGKPLPTYGRVAVEYFDAVRETHERLP
jgi:hypothetical protein